MIVWMEEELLLIVVLLVPQNNQKPNLTLQSTTRRSFGDKKSRPTGRSLWDGGSSMKLSKSPKCSTKISSL